MPPYDAAEFEPPAPIALVTIRGPARNEPVTNVSMLIDSGADVSLLPREPIRHLLDPDEKCVQYELEAFDGARSHAPAVHLELYFLGRVFRGQFLIINQSYGILGRNILNRSPLLLDGPKLIWNEH